MMPSKGWIVIDIETDGEPWDGRLLAIGVADPTDPDVFAAVTPDIPGWLADVLADPDVGTVEHTLYDARWLRLAGYEINGPIADTRVMAWNVDENTPRSLEHLAFRYLSHTMDKRIKSIGGMPKFKMSDGSFVPLGEVPWRDMVEYNKDDVVTTARLFNELKDRQPECWPDQVALTSVILDMECAGIPISELSLSQLRDELTWKIEKVEKTLKRKLPPDFNLNSGDQVAALLFLPDFDLPGRIHVNDPEPKGFTIEKEGRIWKRGHWHIKGYGLQPKDWTDSGKRPKVDDKILKVHYADHPWVKHYLYHQRLVKLKGTYIDSFPRFIHDGRLYGRFNQVGTVTGRLSSSDPNLQNIPRRGEDGHLVRSMFQGDLIVADFSQLEPRLMAHWSEDKELLATYLDNLDIYKEIGSSVFGVEARFVTPGQRDMSKTLMLGMSYGAGTRTIAEQLGINGYPTTQKEASRYLAAMRERFSRFFDWRDEVIDQARKSGFVLTIGGRRRNLDFQEDTWRVERQAVNSIIQGSAADIVNGTMLEVSKIPGARILCQVHDELVIEATDDVDVAKIQEAGEHGHGYRLLVPLIFEPKRVENWGEK